MDNRGGCLSGILKLLLLDWLFDWGQRRFGFGRGGCSGCGCGILMLIAFLVFACMIATNTNWLKLF